ncbi:MAG: aldehyde ferredoxin oxidoreductase family protein [Deltaproteobacteria bacterium]|nr:aldehyde ferredoxin oxidoreductase family protein [Deltaproteobacteria bacterium]
MQLKQKLLLVDLSKGTIEKKIIPEKHIMKLLGGRGSAAYYLNRFIKPGIDPLGPENFLSIGAAILVGTGMPCGGRLQLSSKSPLTDMLGSSNMGGDFGPEMRYAGYDHILVTGKAEHPVYLWINDDDVEIREASMLWGKDTWETEKQIREMHDDQEVKIICIGPAGENLVRYACVISPPKNAAGRTGIGAVMGSKNLKAVAVRGRKGIPLPNPEKVLDLRAELTSRVLKSKAVVALQKYGTMFIYSTANWAGQIRVRNFQENQMKDGRDLEPENFVEKYSDGPVACVSCPVHCRHKYRVPLGEYEGTITEGPEYTFMGAFGTEVGNPRLDVVLTGGHLANLYGIDVLEYGSMLAWAMELYEKGLITKEDTDGVALEWGDPDIIIDMVEKVARREGFGDILAEGPKRAIEKLGKETAYYNINVKGMSGLHSDERSAPSFALGIGVSSRGADHLRSRPALDLLNLPKEVMKNHYGFEVSNDYREYKTKGKVIGWQEALYSIADATGICKTICAFFSPHLFVFKDYANMVREVTGLTVTGEEIHDIGRRIVNLERLFNIREGASRKDDYLPDRFYSEPTPSGPEINRGKVIEREKYDMMLDEYYDYQGWDKEGNPTPGTLKELGLDSINELDLL